MSLGPACPWGDVYHDLAQVFIVRGLVFNNLAMSTRNETRSWSGPPRTALHGIES